MTVLSRRNFNTIEILRVDSDPNGTSAITGSLAKVVGSGVVWKNVGGTSWEVLNSGALAPLSGPAGSPVGSSYVVLGSDGTLTSERVLTAGSGITITDAGAGGNLTISAPTSNGILTLIESKILTSNTQNITFSNLDGDADKFYFMLVKSIIGPNTSNGYVYLNGSSSDMFSAYHQNYYYSATGLLHTAAVYGNFWRHMVNTPPGFSNFSKIFIDAQSGKERFIYSTNSLAGSSVLVGSLGTMIKWTNTTDNLTSISFEGDNANSVYAANTEFHLYKFETGNN